VYISPTSLAAHAPTPTATPYAPTVAAVPIAVATPAEAPYAAAAAPMAAPAAPAGCSGDGRLCENSVGSVNNSLKTP